MGEIEVQIMARYYITADNPKQVGERKTWLLNELTKLGILVDDIHFEDMKK